MSLPTEFVELLRCPVEGQALSLNGDQLSAASTHYPLVGGIPWLLPHPRNSLLDWGAKLNHFQQVLLQEVSELDLQLQSAKGAVHDRIECLLAAKRDFLLEITTLLEPLTRTQVAAEGAYNALRDRAPTTQNLLSYESNIYRDWQWGEEENRLCHDFVRDFMPEDVGRFAVLGAGACRLALDLHQSCAPERTVATDINPLFLFAVNKLLRGESFFLTEFPLHPKLIDYVAIKHQMAGLSERLDNFHLCFADAAKPAFAKGAFNTVLTPWLIDIQPHAFGVFLRQLSQYLPVGGHWVNFGSLVFNQRRESLCYSVEEVVELAAEAGFEVEMMTQTELPYLKSPYSAGYRMENVWAWRATKREDIAAVVDVEVLPEWVLDTHKPIPLSQSLQTLGVQHQFLARLYAALDGKHSIHSLAEHFARADGSDAAELEHLLVTYFQRQQ